MEKSMVLQEVLADLKTEKGCCPKNLKIGDWTGKLETGWYPKNLETGCCRKIVESWILTKKLKTGCVQKSWKLVVVEKSWKLVVVQKRWKLVVVQKKLKTGCCPKKSWKLVVVQKKLKIGCYPKSVRRKESCSVEMHLNFEGWAFVVLCWFLIFQIFHVKKKENHFSFNRHLRNSSDSTKLDSDVIFRVKCDFQS